MKKILFIVVIFKILLMSINFNINIVVHSIEPIGYINDELYYEFSGDIYKVSNEKPKFLFKEEVATHKGVSYICDTGCSNYFIHNEMIFRIFYNARDRKMNIIKYNSSGIIILSKEIEYIDNININDNDKMFIVVEDDVHIMFNIDTNNSAIEKENVIVALDLNTLESKNIVIINNPKYLSFFSNFYYKDDELIKYRLKSDSNVFELSINNNKYNYDYINLNGLVQIDNEIYRDSSKLYKIEEDYKIIKTLDLNEKKYENMLYNHEKQLFYFNEFKNGEVKLIEMNDEFEIINTYEADNDCLNIYKANENELVCTKLDDYKYIRKMEVIEI